MIFSLLAGLLSTLSPCVLPLLPVVFAAAASEHKLAPAALAAGIALSFTAVGLAIALVGFSAGIDAGAIRAIAAILMISVGIVLSIPQIHMRAVAAAGPISNWASHRWGGFSVSGPRGQFALGLLLGAVWSPCVGPTLGAASLMAARGQNLGQVTATMLIFGIGASIPLVIIGLASRRVMGRWRDRLIIAQAPLQVALGITLAAFGILVLTGYDRTIATSLENIAPQMVDRNYHSLLVVIRQEKGARMITVLAYVGAAFAEIGGCFAFWAWARLDKSIWWLPLGLLSLVVFAYLLTLVDSAAAGRAYAAYGGIYVVSSLIWLWAVEGVKPDRWDLTGGVICLIGTAVILLGPRTA